MDRAVFLDRDGTINVEKNYLYRTEDFEFIKGAPEAIKLLNDAGYLVIVVTNQAGVGRAYYTEEDVYILHNYIDKRLEKYKAHIDYYYYCPHHPEYGIGEYKIECNCRKPKDGMLQKAIKQFNIDPKNSYIIGDKLSDVMSGENLGVKGILVKTGYYTSTSSRDNKYIVKDNLLDAVQLILGNK